MRRTEKSMFEMIHLRSHDHRRWRRRCGELEMCTANKFIRSVKFCWMPNSMLWNSSWTKQHLRRIIFGKCRRRAVCGVNRLSFCRFVHWNEHKTKQFIRVLARSMCVEVLRLSQMTKRWKRVANRTKYKNRHENRKVLESYAQNQTSMNVIVVATI